MRKLGRPRSIATETESIIQSLYEKGASSTEIGKQLGLSSSGIRVALHRMGCAPRKRKDAISLAYQKLKPSIYAYSKCGKLDNGVLEGIARRYECGESSVSLAKEFGMTGTTLISGISKYCKIRKNIDASSAVTRTNNFDQSFFEKIDTPEKAYWLGFLWADGHVSKYYVSLVISKKDLGHLLKFKNAVNAKNEIHYRYADNSVGLTLGSKKMTDDLRRLNFTKRKTYDGMPIPEIIPELIGHFWRGVVDGDGNISKSLSVISLCGSRSTCESFLGWVCSFTKCNNSVRKAAHAHCWSVSISGKNNCKNLAEKIGYLDDKNTSLGRKRTLSNRFA